jgi:hypothetical protein
MKDNKQSLQDRLLAILDSRGFSDEPVNAPVLETPVLPYAGTSGWSGSNTSYERAQDNDKSGLTSKNQALFLKDLAVSGATGLTSREWGSLHNFEHQTYSSIPSVLHLGGAVVRLAQRRGRHQIYVLPQHVAGRETAPHASKKKHSCPNCGYSLS